MVSEFVDITINGTVANQLFVEIFIILKFLKLLHIGT
jgi:hypothetical protein